MQDVATQKIVLRKKILEERKSFDESRYFEAGEIICQNIIKLIESFSAATSNSCIGLYYPLQAEPNLLKTLFLMNQKFALPVVTDGEIEYVRYQPGDALEKTDFGQLYQPVKKTTIIPDIIIAPGLAFDIQGYRLGFGKGHFDKYFKKIESIKASISIGTCFHKDLIERLPFSSDDHKLGFIVTEKILVTL